MILFLITIIFTLAGCSNISDDPVANKQRQLYALNKSIDHYPHTSIPTKKKAVFTRHDGIKKSLPKDPQRLAHIIQGQLMQKPSLAHARVQTVSYFGDVLVVGEVGNKKNISMINNLLQENTSVKHHYTYLSDSKGIDSKQRAKDSMIKTSVIKNLSDLDLPTTHLQIISNDGNVYILGKLSSKEQAAVSDSVLSIPGVNTVYFSGKQ